MLLKSNVNNKPERYLAVPLAFTANSPNDPNREQTINIFRVVNDKNTIYETQAFLIKIVWLQTDSTPEGDQFQEIFNI